LLVEFARARVEGVLNSEIGLSLGSPSVNILDPCTGNMMVGDSVMIRHHYLRLHRVEIAY
jgi:hypothetical protein